MHRWPTRKRQRAAALQQASRIMDVTLWSGRGIIESTTPSSIVMNMKAIVTRIKAVHWAWWLLWLGAMALLGLVVINHAGMTKRLGPGWTEGFRYPWAPLPAH